MACVPEGLGKTAILHSGILVMSSKCRPSTPKCLRTTCWEVKSCSCARRKLQRAELIMNGHHPVLSQRITASMCISVKFYNASFSDRRAEESASATQEMSFDASAAFPTLQVACLEGVTTTEDVLREATQAFELEPNALNKFSIAMQRDDNLVGFGRNQVLSEVVGVGDIVYVAPQMLIEDSTKTKNKHGPFGKKIDMLGKAQRPARIIRKAEYSTTKHWGIKPRPPEQRKVRAPPRLAQIESPQFTFNVDYDLRLSCLTPQNRGDHSMTQFPAFKARNLKGSAVRTAQKVRQNREARLKAREQGHRQCDLPGA